MKKVLGTGEMECKNFKIV